MRFVQDIIQLSASDLVNFSGCRHLTELDRSVALGKRSKPDWNQPALVILQQKGQEHEDAYVAYLKTSGLSVIDLMDQSKDAVVNAMAKGYDIITQATLKKDRWMGRSDILRKIPGKSTFGNYSYEVEDTKLSQETKAGTILQLCLYSEMLAEIQGSMPERMHVIKPGTNYTPESFWIQHFSAYFQFMKRQFEEWMAADPQVTYPLPVAKCDTCRWWHHCNKQRHDDDHLSLVAGLQNSHLKELETQEILTLEQYANETEPFRKKPEKGNAQTYGKIHRQAKVQFQGREENRMVYQLLPVQPLKGLNRLPEPCPGDLYFDIEGDHFYADGGLEYLLGIVSKDGKGERSYVKWWAQNRSEEKAAFTQWMNFVMKRWEQYPDFYIYHFAPYEPSAIKRLASRHAIFEQEVDRLLRAERFIDLYAVIREALQASVERYSLKDLERFTRYLRETDLWDASAARRRLAAALELNTPEKIIDDDRAIVERYNEDDCRATEALHQWLEEIFREQSARGAELTRPELKPGDPSEVVDDKDEYARRLYEGLVSRLPADIADYSSEDQGRWLLAHMVDYFRRENRSKYWEYFRLHEMDAVEMLDERHGISFLEFVSEFNPPRGNPIHRYKFPPQEVSLSAPEKGMEEVFGGVIGEIVAISTEEGWVEIKKTRNSLGIHPTAIHTGRPIRIDTLASSLHAFAESVIKDGLNDRDFFAAAKDLLLKNPPGLKGKLPLLVEGEKMEDAAIRIAANLDRNILPIQGPPGTGKTYIGARMIVELVQQGKRIGVTAVSHKVIRNLLDKALELGSKAKVKVLAAHKPGELSEGHLPDGLEEVKSNEEAFAALGKGKVVGGTSWMWAREDAEGALDYLFVDEAGQMSLCNVIACARASSNIILLGDPQQLEQPQQGAHPEGADVSALSHLLDGHQTMPVEKGLFLDTTWRLPPAISAFTSEQYYENRLKSRPELANQQLSGKSPFAGSGLFYVPVTHEGNQNRSTEEIDAIERTVRELLAAGLTWTDREGNVAAITDQDLLIVAPYNAQVSALMDRLPGMRIGTVDKFQGQEAPIVIYSMTSSSPEDAPRGMAFLYDPHRLNVATSRAQCICILVSSPRLFEPECHSVDQMRWANGLCRYGEVASVYQL